MKKNVIFVFVFLFSFSLFSQGISFDDIQFWVGTGSKKAMLIVDFNDQTQPQCFAWGYRFDTTNPTIADMLNAIDDADITLQIEIMDEFLNNVYYKTHQGVGGNPTYWTMMNFISGAWEMNSGIEGLLSDNDIVGCTYSDWIEIQPGVWGPLDIPENPIPAVSTNVGFTNSIHLNSVKVTNPVYNYLNVSSQEKYNSLEIRDMKGTLVFNTNGFDSTFHVDVSFLNSGVYSVTLISPYEVYRTKILKL